MTTRMLPRLWLTGLFSLPHRRVSSSLSSSDKRRPSPELATYVTWRRHLPPTHCKPRSINTLVNDTVNASNMTQFTTVKHFHQTVSNHSHVNTNQVYDKGVTNRSYTLQGFVINSGVFLRLSQVSKILHDYLIPGKENTGKQSRKVISLKANS